MLINLLGNAVKFTSVGSVELAVAPVDPVTPGADCRLRFTVQDTGPGIAAEDLAAIFEPFVQVANGQTVQEGTRPGQQLHPGNPGADRGGCRACAGRDRAAPDATGPGQPVYRQLVVEDSAESRKLLADPLARLGFEVRRAENGQQALKVWAECSRT
ncbi:MAG: ATP-binding protein [Caldilinea sp.]